MSIRNVFILTLILLNVVLYFRKKEIPETQELNEVKFPDSYMDEYRKSKAFLNDFKQLQGLFLEHKESLRQEQNYNAEGTVVQGDLKEIDRIFRKLAITYTGTKIQNRFTSPLRYISFKNDDTILFEILPENPLLRKISYGSYQDNMTLRPEFYIIYVPQAKDQIYDYLPKSSYEIVFEKALEGGQTKGYWIFVAAKHSYPSPNLLP